MSREEKKAFARRSAEAIWIIAKRIWTKCNDLALNIETGQDLSTLAMIRATSCWLDVNLKTKHSDGLVYDCVDYWFVRKIVRLLAPAPDDIIFDLGSGKGRFLCVVARRHVRKCVGVEFSPSLCEIAKMNARRLRGRKAEIDVVCADCSDADLHDGTIYYMFNPFGERTMRDVLEKIYVSLLSNPRQIKIVYTNPVHETLLTSSRWLELFEEFHTFRGQRITFWKNRRIPLT